MAICYIVMWCYVSLVAKSIDPILHGVSLYGPYRLDVAISLKIRVLGKKLDTGFQQFMRILLTRWLFSKQRYKRQRVAVVPKVETCTIYRIVNRTIQHNTTPILLKGYCIPPSTWHFESTSRVSHSEAYVLLINCQVSNAQIVWCLLVKTTYHIHKYIYILIDMYDVCGYILDIIYIYTHIRIQHYRLVAFSQRLAFIHKPGGFFLRHSGLFPYCWCSFGLWILLWWTITSSIPCW